jgi:hypothetical protein
MARRLIERGVADVQLCAPSAADFRRDITAQDRARWTDRPLAALLGDLEQRGMLDFLRVVWMNRADEVSRRI